MTTSIDEALRALIREEVRAVLAEHYPSAPAVEWVALSTVPLPMRALHRAVRSGALPAKRIGRSLFVARADLDAWVETENTRASATRVAAERKRQASRAPAGDELDRALRRGGLRLAKVGSR